MTVEHVEWDDSAAHIETAWVTAKGFVPGALRCFSVGYVVDEDDDSLTLAMSFNRNGDNEVEEYGLALSIPKSAIRVRVAFESRSVSVASQSGPISLAAS